MTAPRVVCALLYLALLAGGLVAGDWAMQITVEDLRPSTEPRLHAMLMSALGLYVLASAVPFVPGAEIGLGLLLTFGERVAVLVYAAMVAALTISYGVGRFVPSRLIALLFGHLGLRRAQALVLRMAPLAPSQRVDLLASQAPRRLVPVLLRHRYLALALVLNIPGNSLLGGGGGIALAAGMSGLYTAPAYLATLCVAVAPLPALVLLSGGLP